jgi:hypothetical protein
MDRRPPIIPALLLLSTCVSLSDSSPPPPPPPPPGSFADFIHPDSATGAVAAMEGAVAAPVYRSFVTFAPALSIAGGHAPVPVAPSGSFRCAAGGAPLAAASVPRSIATAAFPDSVLSHVFAYDSATQSFKAASDSGGPANGVRFLLAQVDSVGRPMFPLTTVGWLDVTDHSPVGGPDSLGGVLVGQGTPLLDYFMAPSGTSSAYSERIGGTFRGGAATFLFRDSTARVGTQVAVTAIVDDSTHRLHATLTASRTSTDRYDWFYKLDFALRYGSDSIRLSGVSDVYCLLPSIGVTVLVHDSTFASVTNGATPALPTITRGDGQPVTAAQATAVLDLLRLQGELFSWMETFSLPGSLLLGQ